jgi:hypothetical protein
MVQCKTSLADCQIIVHLGLKQHCTCAGKLSGRGQALSAKVGGLYGARLLDGQLFLELSLPFVQFSLTVTCRLQGQSRHSFKAPAKLQPPIDWVSLVQGENRLCFQFATRSANLGLCVSQRRSTVAVRDLHCFPKKQYWQVVTTVIFRAFDSLSSHHARRESS